MSLQWVNSNVCFLRFGFGLRGVLVVVGAPRTHNISSLNLVGHLHGSNHDGMVLSRVWLFILPTLIFLLGCLVMC